MHGRISDVEDHREEHVFFTRISQHTFVLLPVWEIEASAVKAWIRSILGPLGRPRVKAVVKVVIVVDRFAPCADRATGEQNPQAVYLQPVQAVNGCRDDLLIAPAHQKISSGCIPEE